mmetsp:Transcript_73886/g.138062  ORF Transcript_73886/g.138062 Transcript_73886/m.138062 type:complete len:149 (+) Transcript_73886:90-536(+)
MQIKVAAVLALAMVAGCAGVTMRGAQQQTPEEVALDMEFRAKDSFGNNELTPPCANIKCGEYSCPAPLELKVDGTCCGYCYAEDHVIAVDRHQVTEYNATGFAIEQCESAPSTCKAPGPEVRCFKPQCRAGDAPHCAPGSCCPMCSGR